MTIEIFRTHHNADRKIGFVDFVFANETTTTKNDFNIETEKL